MTRKVDKKRKNVVKGKHNACCLQFTKDIEADVNQPFEELSKEEQLRLVKEKLMAEDPLYSLLFSNTEKKDDNVEA